VLVWTQLPTNRSADATDCPDAVAVSVQEVAKLTKRHTTHVSRRKKELGFPGCAVNTSEDKMDELSNLTDAQLQTLRTSCQDILTSIVESLKDRVDIQEVMVQLVASDNIAQTLIEFPDDDLARLTLPASVAALVNTQSVMAIDAELARRAGLN
jgi:hypothetical protein